MVNIARLLFFVLLASSALAQGHKHLLIAPRSGVRTITDDDIFGIPSIVFWVRAGDNTYSDAGTTPCVDGDRVMTWISKTNGYKCIQATAGNRPIYKSTIFTNNKPALAFDGYNNNYLACATGVAWNQSNTVFMVLIITNMNANSEFMMDSTNAAARGAIYKAAAASHRYSMYLGGPGSFPNPSQAWTNDMWNYYEFVAKDTDGIVRVSPQNTDILMNGNTAGTQPIDGVMIGTRVDVAANTYFFGHMAELIIFNGAFSYTNRNTLSNYFKQRYKL